MNERYRDQYIRVTRNEDFVDLNTLTRCFARATCQESGTQPQCLADPVIEVGYALDLLVGPCIVALDGLVNQTLEFLLLLLMFGEIVQSTGEGSRSCFTGGCESSSNQKSTLRTFQQ